MTCTRSSAGNLATNLAGLGQHILLLAQARTLTVFVDGGVDFRQPRGAGSAIDAEQVIGGDAEEVGESGEKFDVGDSRFPPPSEKQPGVTPRKAAS